MFAKGHQHHAIHKFCRLGWKEIIDKIDAFLVCATAVTKKKNRYLLIKHVINSSTGERA